METVHLFRILEGSTEHFRNLAQISVLQLHKPKRGLDGRPIVNSFALLKMGTLYLVLLTSVLGFVSPFGRCSGP